MNSELTEIEKQRELERMQTLYFKYIKCSKYIINNSVMKYVETINTFFNVKKDFTELDPMLFVPSSKPYKNYGVKKMNVLETCKLF